MKFSNVQKYIISIFLSNIGNALVFSVVGISLYEATGLVISFGILILLEQLTSFVLSMTASKFTMHYGGRKTFFSVDIILALLSLSFAVLYHLNGAIVVLALLVFLQNLIKPIQINALYVIKAESFESNEFTKVNSFGATLQQLGLFAGFAMSAFLINLISVSAILVIDGITFLLSAISVYSITTIKGGDKRVISSLREKFALVGVSSEVMRSGFGERGLVGNVYIFCIQMFIVSYLMTYIFSLDSESQFKPIDMLVLYTGCVAVISFIVGKTLKEIPDKFMMLVTLIQAISFGMLFLGSKAFIPVSIICIALGSCIIFPGTINRMQRFNDKIHPSAIGSFRGSILAIMNIPLLFISLFLVRASANFWLYENANEFERG